MKLYENLCIPLTRVGLNCVAHVKRLWQVDNNCNGFVKRENHLQPSYEMHKIGHHVFLHVSIKENQTGTSN